LSIPSDNMKSATASLAKYIVFSKAELIDITQQYHMVGIQGKAVIATAKTYFEHWPTESGTVVNSEQGTVICLENDTCELWLSKEMSESLQQKLSTYPVYSDNYWDYVLIRLGIGEVRQASSELWTPHAINLQEIGDGVSFNKGCYTGQEVVARMEYLGTLKRKMYIFTTPATIRDLPAIATPLYTTGKIQSIGHIVTAAKNPHQPDKPAILAASVAVKQVEENEVYMDSECQHKLTLFKQG
jgi:folate-binding protein YgfZ